MSESHNSAYHLKRKSCSFECLAGIFCIVNSRESIFLILFIAESSYCHIFYSGESGEYYVWSCEWALDTMANLILKVESNTIFDSHFFNKRLFLFPVDVPVSDFKFCLNFHRVIHIWKLWQIDSPLPMTVVVYDRV
jgi:hypothetical protein